MFTIKTAKPGFDYHVLVPREHLNYVNVDLANAGYTWFLGLRIEINPHGQRRYTFTYLLENAEHGRLYEVLTKEALAERRLTIPQESDSDMMAVPADGYMYQSFKRCEDHFRAMMQMDLFALPLTC